MGEYYGEPFQKLSKSPKNNMDEAEFIPKVNVKYLKRKKKKKKTITTKKFKRTKKIHQKKVAKKEFLVNFVRYFRLWPRIKSL